MNLKPKIEKDIENKPSDYIPAPFMSVCLIAADMEFAWAWRYAKGKGDPRMEALRHARTARENIPKILDMCDRYNIPITWATVGHLFLKKCKRDNHFAHPSVRRLPYHENEYWRFDKGDWFDDDPCTDWQTSPGWYAPDLIERIISASAKHEIACHTFSHIDCSDDVCAPGVLVDEVVECQKQAAKYGVKLETFVHPGHTIGNLKTLRELGFRSFRTDYINMLGYPQRNEHGLWEMKSTMEFVYKSEWSIDYHVHRYKEIINRALAFKKICLFWFHPSMNSIFVDEIMPRVFSYLDAQRRLIWLTTVKNYLSWLDSVRNV